MKNFLQYLNERSNAHLLKAKITKDDEFYTSYDHAEMMLTPFSKYFAGKKILCNCDDPYKSEIFDFMRDNFKKFKMKQLVGVGYKSKMQIITDDAINDIDVTNDGDFRRGESLTALENCDIVVSNPPFSDNMFIDFIKLTMKNNKDLIAIGPLDGAKAKDIKPYIINDSLYVIKSPYQNFIRPSNAKSSATSVKVAIFTTFEDDPFGQELNLDNNIDILKLPIDSQYAIPISISHDRKFSIKEIPAYSSGVVDKIIVPLHIFRKNWRKTFKIVDIMGSVKYNNKILMSGVLMQYI